MSESPVFVDDVGRRRRLVCLIALGLAAAAVLWLVAVAASFVGFRPLPIPVLENDRPEPAAAGSKPFSAVRAREPDGDRSPAPLRSSAATSPTDGVKGAPAGRRRPSAPSGEPAPRVLTGRAAPAARRPNRPSSRSPDAILAPTPAPPPAGRPGGDSPATTAPQAPAPPATTEASPTTPVSVTQPRMTPTAPPEQRDERAAGDPAFSRPLDGRPADAGRPGS